LKIILREHFSLEGIPSGSALESIGDRYLLFGDDSPYLHILTAEWLPLEIIALPGQDTGYFRIPKPIKHDIESAFSCISGQYVNIYGLGSGAVSPLRDIIYNVNHNTLTGWMDIQTITATPLYDNIREIMGNKGSLNLEGASLCGDQLILSQRGHLEQDNYLFILPFIGEDTFTQTSKKDIRMIKVILPAALTGYGVSGLVYDTLGKKLWCCGSYEKITDTYNDGEIGNSFIGFMELDGSKDTDSISLSKWSEILLTDNRLPIKLESLVLRETTKNSAIVHAVADDDKGGTEVAVMEVSW